MGLSSFAWETGHRPIYHAAAGAFNAKPPPYTPGKVLRAFANPEPFRYNNGLVYDAVRQAENLNDVAFMRRALDLAARGVGTTLPNPHVGAVMVRAGAVVGEGFHRKAGEPHAEVLALREAGDKARGATVYVTLEPCAHRGRTGPCADALVAAGVAEVVVASDDPNPLVSGQGYARLERAGIRVRRGVLGAEAARLNEAFLYAVKHGRPFMHVKWAMTLDGKNGPPSGGTQAISGPAGRRYVHGLRAASDAVLVGGETVRTDDPQLTVREFAWDDGRELRQPARIVVTNRPVDVRRRVFAPDAARTVLFGRDPGAAQLELLRREGVAVEVLPGPEGLQWERALAKLGERELRSVLVEAGPRLAGELVRRRLAQRVTVLISARVLGGEHSRSAVGGPDPASLADALALTDMETAVHGDDIIVTGRVAER
jgi:diaminohydroxyphosphoribosylaminopyrimidine deaminase/5-amino-6-(5-phosphoribosylamino)uracil reductase